MMQQNKYDILRANITEKFGSLRRFSKISGINYFSTVRKLNDQEDDEFFEKIKELVKSTKDDRSVGNFLTDEMRDKLKAGILNHPDALKDGKILAKNFIEKHDQFSQTYLSMLFSRKDFKIKNVTKKVKELAQILNIDLNGN